MSVIRQNEHWVLYKESDTGIRARVYDVVIPDDLSVSQLCTYLDDVYHEYASETHPQVVCLTDI